MPPQFWPSLATRSGRLYPGLSPAFIVRTDFDYESAWNAACHRDDLEGEKEAQENPALLRGEPEVEPDNLPDFDISSDEDVDCGTELSSPLMTPSASPTTPHSNLPPALTTRVVVPMFCEDKPSSAVDKTTQHPTTHRTPSSSPLTFATLTRAGRANSDSEQQDVGDVRKKKRKRGQGAKAANTARADKKRREETAERREAGRMPVHGQGYVNRYLKVDTVTEDFDVFEYRAVQGGDTGKVDRRRGEKVQVALEGAEETGHSIFYWNGIRTTHIIDRTNHISIVCVGKPVETDSRPQEKTWDASMEHLGGFLETTRQKYASTLSVKDRHNRRGPYPGVSVGFTRGSGSLDVHNLQHKKVHRPMVRELVENHDAQRVVAFQNESLAAHFPKVYCDLKEKVEAICKHHPKVKPTFPSHSIYPGCTFNLGPETVTEEHTDPGNIPVVPCSVTALGDYDPNLGGHLVLEDLKLIIRFPPGSTILLSSASIRHSNIRIQKGEKRYSITQFCPGGLYRWVRHGFRPACTLSKRQREALDGDAQARWKSYWDLLSTPESLREDRLFLVEKEEVWLGKWTAARE